MTQIQNIREHLLNGNTITPAEAVVVFGCFRLAAVIEDLRQDFMKIDTVMCHDAMGKKYARYSLHREVRQGDAVQVRLGHGGGLPKWLRRAKRATVKAIYQDVAYVEFVRGTRVATEPLHIREIVRA